MERYKISIGSETWDFHYDRGMKTSRMLKLKINNSFHFVDEIYKLLSRNAESLYLDGSGDVEKMLCDTNFESFGQLRFIKVKNRTILKNLFSFSIIKRLNQLEELEVLFSALEELEVEKCPKLKYIFPSSMVKSFVHLKTLKVSKCDEMEAIVEGMLSTEERISNNYSVFPKLDSLILLDLPQLNIFCCGMNPVEFPSLKKIHIIRCTALNTFVYDDGKSSPYFFDEKVMLPVLEELNIQEMYNLERLWPDLLVQQSFSKLTSIALGHCPMLLNVFPLSMLTRLQRLDKLRLWDCESIEEIIFVSESGGGRLAMDVVSFEFPSLTSLVLFLLPNLKSLHHNKMHTINWPSLKWMRVSGCDRVETLFSAGETSSELPLFCVTESTFPNLQKITLGWNAEMEEMIWHCQGQQEQQILSPYFPNLKVVKLEGYSKQVTVLPSYLFQLLSLSNLQTLKIRDSCFKELIFQSEDGGEEKPASVLLSQITELRLKNLPDLMHLWKEKEGFQNLRRLDVSWCPKLKLNLVPSSVSFRNLMTLRVQGCKGLIKLITPSTAKSLGQLKDMIIKNCKNIEEIIQGGDNEDEISFPQLHLLELFDLPQLESFCSSGNYTFAFSSLEILLLYDCPKMKMFTQGDSNTPMLHKIQKSRWGGEEHCEGSLNNTIQKLFRTKNYDEEQTISSASMDSEEDEILEIISRESTELHERSSQFFKF